MLTEKGIDLAPIIMELVLWSDKYLRTYNPNMNNFERQNINKVQFIERAQNDYRAFFNQTIRNEA